MYWNTGNDANAVDNVTVHLAPCNGLVADAVRSDDAAVLLDNDAVHLVQMRHVRCVSVSVDILHVNVDVDCHVTGADAVMSDVESVDAGVDAERDE